MKISLRKKIKLYFEYRTALSRIDYELIEKFNCRIDSVGRLYTVLNIPKELIEEPYNLRKSDIDALANNFIREYSLELFKFLDTKELKELYKFYEAKKVDKYSYLLVYGFSLFDTKKAAIKLLWSLPIILLILTIIFYKLYTL